MFKFDDQMTNKASKETKKKLHREELAINTHPNH